MSGAPDTDDLISRIERDCDEVEIIEARRKLFTFFSDVICKERKKAILDIDRKSKNRGVLG